MKFKTPQLLINYLGGSGVEWLAIQLSKHDKYQKHYNYHSIHGDNNEYNRWRINPGWRSTLLDNQGYASVVWTEQDYDNSTEWWDNYNQQNKETENWLPKIQRCFEKDRTSIPVHRCHEAWYDVHLAEYFEDFKIVNIAVDKFDDKSVTQFRGNIMKKIYWQDLSKESDLWDEMKDKCRKFGVDVEHAKQTMAKMSKPINYTDMMFGLNYCKHRSLAFNKTVDMLSDRWNWDMIDQYHHPIKDFSYQVDFRKMFIDKDYDEYANMCHWIGCTPWSPEVWNETLSAYVDQDMENIITLEEIEDRLCLRQNEIQ